MITKLGHLIEYIQACASHHRARPDTPIYIREGANGPLRQISQVRMGEDQRGRYVVLETDSSIIQ